MFDEFYYVWATGPSACYNTGFTEAFGGGIVLDNAARY
jgi:hypothetical protein